MSAGCVGAAEYSMCYLGDPVLHTPTRPVEADDMARVRNVLLPTMHKTHAIAWTAGAGLAANQAGGDLRVAIAKVGTEGSGASGEWLEMINPRITDASPAVALQVEEGCLSVPFFRTSKMRHTWVVVAWQDPSGQHHERKFAGFDAQLMQHELDHLDGRVIVDGCSRQQRRSAERAVADYLGKQSR